MQQGIKKLQWCEYLKLVFLEILNPLLCWIFANQVTFCDHCLPVFIKIKCEKSYFEAFCENLVPRKIWTLVYSSYTPY